MSYLKYKNLKKKYKLCHKYNKQIKALRHIGARRLL